MRLVPIKARRVCLRIRLALATLTVLAFRPCFLSALGSVGIRRALLSSAVRSVHVRRAATPDDDRAHAGPLSVSSLRVGQQLQGTIVKIVRMGAFVDIGVEKFGLVPRNKLTEGFTASVEDVVRLNQQVTAWVSEVTSEKLILSLVESKVPSKGQVVPSSLKSVDASLWFPGTVVALRSYGAMVSLTLPGESEKTIGLVHFKEIKSDFVYRVEDELVVGQEVQARVLDIIDGRPSLSMKNQSSTPTGASSNIKSSNLTYFESLDSAEWIPGRVEKLLDYGALVKVSPPDGHGDVRGLLHNKEIKQGFVSNVGDELSVDQEIWVRVLSTDVKTGRLSLSMKTAQKVQDLSGFQNIEPSEWLEGSVTGIENFGAFVTITPPAGGPPARGLVHISRIADKYVSDVAEFVEIGKDVKVRVLGASLETGKLDLSMKPEVADAVETA